MYSKRSISPGPIDLMPEIQKLIAEPSLSNSRRRAAEVRVQQLSPVNSRKREVHVQRPVKVINHDYCDECKGGGEIICCDRCPKSYHINCHIPMIIKLPDGEWFCKSCTSDGNAEPSAEVPIVFNSFENEEAYVDAILNRCFPKNDSFKPLMQSKPELDIERIYNVKLPARKQLDKLKMIRKTDRCTLCKKGILRGRLVQCHYCSKLYHLNCMDPPIRDWDHSMRWLCPAHNAFYEVAYPGIFAPGHRTLTDSLIMRKHRCELPSLPVNTSFNIPSHIDAMYKKPEENIPATSVEKSSLTILCNVASRELESINSNHKINRSVDNICNDAFTEFLQPNLDTLQKNNCLLHKQPTATLSCLSMPIDISIKNKSLTIGKNTTNNFCVLPYGNCEYISGLHATITYDDKLGDYLVKNHSRHGMVVDNVSYFGNHRPKDLSNSSEQNRINSQVKKHINKRRRSVRKHDMFRILKNTECETIVMQYVNKKRKFDYRQVSRFYLSKLKNFHINNNKHAYRRPKCMCSKRFIPKDGYAGVAVLRNESIMSIGCMKFKFTYDTVKLDSCTKEVPIVHKEAKEEITVRNKQPLNKTCLKYQSEQENCINKVKDIGNKLELVINNGHCSLDDKRDTNFLNEQKIINTFSIDKIEDRGPLNGKIKINGMSDGINSQNNKDVQILDTNLSISPDIPSCTKQWTNKNGISSKMQSCFANDLIQEVEINELSDDGDNDDYGGETIEEEIVYYEEVHNNNSVIDYNGRDWIIEEIVVGDKVEECNDNGDSVEPQLPTTEEHLVHDHNNRAIKTEHLYCARSPSYNDEIIIISDDDDDDE